MLAILGTTILSIISVVVLVVLFWHLMVDVIGETGIAEIVVLSIPVILPLVGTILLWVVVLGHNFRASFIITVYVSLALGIFVVMSFLVVTCYISRFKAIIATLIGWGGTKCLLDMDGCPRDQVASEHDNSQRVSWRNPSIDIGIRLGVGI